MSVQRRDHFLISCRFLFRYSSSGSRRILPARVGPPREHLLQQAGGGGAAVWALQPSQHHPEIQRLGLHHLRHQVLGAHLPGRLLEGLHQRLAAGGAQRGLYHGFPKAGRGPWGHQTAGQCWRGGLPGRPLQTAAQPGGERRESTRREPRRCVLDGLWAAAVGAGQSRCASCLKNSVRCGCILWCVCLKGP